MYATMKAIDFLSKSENFKLSTFRDYVRVS